ncbi:MAG: FKBP-type peptidyl-prolyl cis-trans isomerase [Candidatus Algichlamydia australiensis]|nr:FKBP-type peptidyl-prolyl cis-trans isomerase [Chlamydiales bacterium]
MKTKDIIYLFLGLISGILITHNWELINKTKVNKANEALGNMLYQELQKFPKEWELEQIFHVMKDLESGKHSQLDTNEQEKLLLKLASKKADERAKKNLAEAETFLSHLPAIHSVIDQKVYFEIIKEGKGDTILQTKDKVSVCFKQFGIDGKILKDTGEKSFVIPMSQMIKGFQIGMEGAKVGEIRKIYIHPDYGFGKIGRGQEPNQLLIYEVQVTGIEPAFGQSITKTQTKEQSRSFQQ